MSLRNSHNQMMVDLKQSLQRIRELLHSTSISSSYATQAKIKGKHCTIITYISATNQLLSTSVTNHSTDCGEVTVSSKNTSTSEHSLGDTTVANTPKRSLNSIELLGSKSGQDRITW